MIKEDNNHQKVRKVCPHSPVYSRNAEDNIFPPA
jgi:hypothetical protein